MLLSLQERELCHLPLPATGQPDWATAMQQAAKQAGRPACTAQPHLLVVEVVGQAANEDAIGGVRPADVLLQPGRCGSSRLGACLGHAAAALAGGAGRSPPAHRPSLALNYATGPGCAPGASSGPPSCPAGLPWPAARRPDQTSQPPGQWALPRPSALLLPPPCPGRWQPG